MNLRQIQFCETSQPIYEVSYSKSYNNISTNPRDNPLPGRPVRVKQLNGCQVQIPENKGQPGVSIVGGVAYHIGNKAKRPASSTLTLGSKRGRAKTQMGEVANAFQEQILRCEQGKKTKEEVELIKMMQRLEKQCGINKCESHEVEIEAQQKFEIQKTIQKEEIEKSRMNRRNSSNIDRRDSIKQESQNINKLMQQIQSSNDAYYKPYESPIKSVESKIRPDSASLFHKIDHNSRAEIDNTTFNYESQYINNSYNNNYNSQKEHKNQNRQISNEQFIYQNAKTPPQYPQHNYESMSQIGSPSSLYRYGKQTPKTNASIITEMSGMPTKQIVLSPHQETQKSVIYQNTDLIRSTFDEVSESPCFITLNQKKLFSSQRVSETSSRRRSTVVEPFSCYQ
ncbi:hypothetical protein SS50377_26915 [Spironucleus salmonicida]|uniref:Uncharacterized protein n=1 Tax=Spironucleus salmonicida TaxID=348837 RepID=V6LUP4_9EUKA|nr:hypothetical protein SS50377_26915 [Spironucleus salmonicida]|eukprot:EST47426.1 Hypothetical protein SS50377_12411 [Spironucleus salmonicida]